MYLLDNKGLFKFIFMDKLQLKPIDLGSNPYSLGRPFAEDIYIEKTFLKFKEKYGIVNAIETGTHIGATFIWLYNNFDNVYTCEIDEKFYQLACKFIFGYENEDDRFHKEIINPPDMGKMVMKNIDTVNFMKEICPTLTGESIFFLDAHWESYCPLLDELSAISEADLKPAVIAIHDFKTDHPTVLGYDTYNEQEYDLDWIKPSIDRIYGANWSFEYNTPEEAKGTSRGIIYIKREDDQHIN